MSNTNQDLATLKGPDLRAFIRNTDKMPLSIKTRVYWIVSSITKGHLPQAMTTEDALTILRETMDQVGPQRPIYNTLAELIEKIIVGE